MISAKSEPASKQIPPRPRNMSPDRWDAASVASVKVSGWPLGTKTLRSIDPTTPTTY